MSMRKIRAFGDRIRELRKRRGMTQRELAEASGVSESAISSFELGVRYPRDGYVIHIAAALGVRPEAFEVTGIETNDQLMHALFNLEERFGLIPVGGSIPALVVGFNDDELTESMRQWAERRVAVARGDMTVNEYRDWKDSYRTSEGSLK